MPVHHISATALKRSLPGRPLAFDLRCGVSTPPGPETAHTLVSLPDPLRAFGTSAVPNRAALESSLLFLFLVPRVASTISYNIFSHMQINSNLAWTYFGAGLPEKELPTTTPLFSPFQQHAAFAWLSCVEGGMIPLKPPEQLSHYCMYDFQRKAVFF